jgi:arsenate reductase
MNRLGRSIVVAVANGIVGAILGAVIGLAGGLVYLLLFGNSEPYPLMCLGGAILGAATMAVAAVFWDNGETIWLFYQPTGFVPKPKESTRPGPPPERAAAAPERREMSLARKPAILFLCTGNSARSQMAEAFLKIHAGTQFEVLSAGFAPRAIHPLTFQVMKEVGIDLAGHRAKGLQEFLGKTPVCCAITVCQDTEPGCPAIWPGARGQLAWPFDDPAAADAKTNQLDKFRRVRDQIRQKIDTSLPELVSACSKSSFRLGG